ncbi:c-type cytochrome [Duganella sp. sic0402]|uniref:cytochrome c oxidase subunit II n=1 Tax=Duganella sp. sic0402 TaxID=2854786 RepID=UPI001C474B18|nr:c-type cytochrome [Duganella sp. sic0402]MBV7535044.1 c-type cytochrome [Duganella sp. sic0402]
MTYAQQSALHPAGPDAEIIAQLAWVLTGGAAVVFVGVMALCVLGLRKRRVVHIRWWLWGGGVVLPLLVLSALLAFSTLRSTQLSMPSSQHAVKIAVIARLWWWEVRYTDPAGGPDIVLANEIRLPAGQPVYLGLSSADVIHSFWAPALAGKVDMVPGRLHGMTIRADRAGVYRAQCAEYCGEQHARMALHVVAQSQQAFDAWLAAQAAPARTTADARFDAGRKAFAQQRCSACHTVRGADQDGAARAWAGGEGALGPDLTHIGSRLYIGAGTLRNDAGALAAWIANPHGFKPGVRMPASADMDGETLQALAGYLEQLK